MAELPYRAPLQLSAHAAEEIARRSLALNDVQSVLSSPAQWFYVRPGRIVVQSISPSDPSILIRVFVDIDREPAVIVTAYQTSKISKYWRTT